MRAVLFEKWNSFAISQISHGGFPISGVANPWRGSVLSAVDASPAFLGCHGPPLSFRPGAPPEPVAAPVRRVSGFCLETSLASAEDSEREGSIC